ncbi:MAG: DinB family protein, partial [Thermoanaerobaculia bacterium]|nr:DinB family protein [Thermoanaerobaculia bacterium]
MKRNNLLDEALEAWEDARKGVLSEAENIPEDRYEFRPTESVRSVGELVAHILEVSEMMVGELT